MFLFKILNRNLLGNFLIRIDFFKTWGSLKKSKTQNQR